MTARTSMLPLLLGLLLVVFGCFFFVDNLYGFSSGWLWLFSSLISLFLLAAGLSKVFRHFSWPQEELVRHPGKTSLLGGIFWISAGLLWLANLLGYLEILSFFGRYWPLILILLGLGQFLDFFRFQGRLRFQVSELLGIFLIVLLGFISAWAAETRFLSICFDL